MLQALPHPIDNTYPFLPEDNPDYGIIVGATSSKVSRSWLPMHHTPFGTMHISYHSANDCLPPIMPANVQLALFPMLGSAHQWPKVLVRVIVHVAGNPHASVGTNLMYGRRASVLSMSS